VILVDTNVLLDVATDDPVWRNGPWLSWKRPVWKGPLLINDAVYTELSVRYDRIEALEMFIQHADLQMRPIPRPALFLAGRVFTLYRRAGGSRTGVLPDFFIGAHAAVSELRLLTRDVGRYRTYFPTVQLIAPD
jgi:predicted nucleic acid-binding protein